MKGKIAALLILSLLIVGCSQQQTSDTITLGFAGPLTGDISSLGIPAKNAAELAVDEVNAEGGINGKQIEMVYEDTKCNGKEAVSAVNKLVNIDKVVAIVGALCSSASSAAYPISEEGNTIMISPASSNPSLTEDTPLFFRTFPSDALQAKVSAEMTLDSGYEDVAVIHINDEYGAGFKDVYAQNIERLGGNIVAVESYAQGDSDFKTQLEKIRDEEPDFLLSISFPKAGGLIAKQASELGLDIPMRGTEATFNEEFIQIASPEVAEGFTATAPASGEGEVYENYMSAYAEKYSEPTTVGSKEAYDAVKLYAYAMKECGTTTEQIKTCLEDVEDFEGASGTITFDEYGDVIKGYDVYQVQNGEWVKQT